MTVELPASLDLGKLLRLRGMATAATQTDATVDSANALFDTYMRLRGEIHNALESDQTIELQEEFERLFPALGPPGFLDLGQPAVSNARMTAAATEAHTQLGQLVGWIQGLIDTLTFEDQLRIEAEASAREQKRPGVGFTRGV